MKQFGYFFVCAMLCAACGGHGHDDHAEDDCSKTAQHEAQEDEHNNHEGDEVVLTIAQQQRIGISVSNIRSQAFSGVLKVGGTLTSSPTDAVTVVAPASGQISVPTGIVKGAEVSRGDVLFTVETETLAQTSSSARLHLSLEAAEQRLKRAKTLLQEQLISQREVDDLQAEYNIALAEYTAATRNGDKQVAVKTTMSGFITSTMVQAGDYVQAGQALTTITRGRSMLLRADVPERLFNRLGDIVSARFKPSYSNEVLDIDSLNGRLTAREVSAERNGGYLTVIFALSNPGSLVPGCYADVWLMTRNKRDALCVPLGALVREGDLFFVFVKEDESCFAKREVLIGDSNGSQVEIVSGLTEGDNVVTTGTAQLALAASARVIPAHSHNH